MQEHIKGTGSGVVLPLVAQENTTAQAPGKLAFSSGSTWESRTTGHPYLLDHRFFLPPLHPSQANFLNGVFRIVSHFSLLFAGEHLFLLHLSST